MARIDLSKFKKVASDDSSTTLEHTDGHMFKVAHAPLSKQTRAELDALHLDEGTPEGTVGDAEDAAGEEQDVQPTPAQENEHGIDPRATTEGVKYEANKKAWEDAHSLPTSDQPADNEPPPTQTDQQSPMPQESRDVASTPPMDPVQKEAYITNLLTDESNKQYQDMLNGHVEPKTYKQLFDDKDLTGKIGTVVGLLASGIGSGLTHSPNAVLQMMDNLIDRDMSAQEQSKQNAVKFMSAPWPMGRIFMLNAVKHSLYDQASKMPPGMSKSQFSQMLPDIDNRINTQIGNLIQNKAKISSNAPQASSGILNNNVMEQVAQEEAGGFPGTPPGTYANIIKESGTIEGLRQRRQIGLSAFDSLAQPDFLGKKGKAYSPQQRAALVASASSAVSGNPLDTNSQEPFLASLLGNNDETLSMKRNLLNKKFDALEAQAAPNAHLKGALMPLARQGAASAPLITTNKPQRKFSGPDIRTGPDGTRYQWNAKTNSGVKIQ